MFVSLLYLMARFAANSAIAAALVYFSSDFDDLQRWSHCIRCCCKKMQMQKLQITKKLNIYRNKKINYNL